MAKKRISLGPDFHAEPGETKGHQHDVYTTAGELHGWKRLHMGTLMKRAVEGLATALAEAEARGRRQGLEWQPIETAPCDELVWLFEPHEMGGFMFAGLRKHVGDAWTNNLDHAVQRPTLWMPLPPDPSRATAPAETQKPETGESHHGQS